MLFLGGLKRHTNKTDVEKVQSLSEIVKVTKASISRAIAVRRSTDSGRQLKAGSKSQVEFSDLAKELF